ncbi:uncharacterized protein LOC132744724 [Ruditapes philippinarum]|uniref:uncharacterized protein LOC132744724 n=1 Tax=Ruditapes philippinarum TaxID=129788 RepID=UPI00295B3F69|nr:uncharacterized protein LOC132744724 [Ruditapes philippinarum]
MEPSKSCDVTRGHEHYLCHILLLEQASPIALKAIIKREEKKYGKDIGILLNENRDAFKTQYETEFLQLIQEDDVNDDIDTWDTLQLCAVTLVLFKSDLTEPEVKAIQCIYDQRKDIEQYTECASLTFNTYNEKQHLLHDQLLELITLIDDQAKLDCKCMMFSFESKSLKLSKTQIDKLTQTHDIKTHLNIALDVDVVTENDIIGEENHQKLQTNGQRFTETLQNKNVYINDSAILTCKLNIPTDKNVEWRKDYKPVEMSNNIMVMCKNGNYWLAISRASLEDTGQYTCVCGNISTSADLTVIDEALCVVVDMPANIEVTENRNIDTECKVNLLTSKPVWRYKGEILQSSGRKVILAKGSTHKLMITNVTLDDEGEYTVDFGNVSCKTTVQIQVETDLIHRKQITEELFRNWMRGALALKYLKIGLEGFSDKAVHKQHNDLMKKLGNSCSTCTEESLLPHKQDQCPRQRKHQCLCTKGQKQKSRQMCPNGGFCGNVYNQIVYKHRFQDPLFTNTDIQKWSSDAWSVATCFVNTTGYKGKQSAKDVDCSGLLSMCINNIDIEMMLGEVIIDGKIDAFTKAREARNDILHSPNYELSENQLNTFIIMFIEVLEIQDKHGNTPLKGESGVEEALRLLDMVQQNQIEINLEKDMRELREHGMSRLEKKYQTAQKQASFLANAFEYCYNMLLRPIKCLGIKQVISERSYVEQKRRLNIKSIKGSYNVSVRNTLINSDNNDQVKFFIARMCMLPNSEVLLADVLNNRLKKLNSSYKVVSHCDVPEDPYSVCYIGNDTAVASFGGNSIQYVNVSGNINLRQIMELDHACLGLACHGDTLYVSSVDTVYKYDKYCKQKQVIYDYREHRHTFIIHPIAISDNGERIYFKTIVGVTTIDAKGNHISSHFDDEYNIRDICIAGEGIVLALDVSGNNLHQLDYTGKKHQTADSRPLTARSMCFDRERCRLIVCGSQDKIHVYKCEYLPS